MYYPSSYWKIKAREALRDHWLTALLIALIVNLPSLLVQGIASMTGNDLITRMQEAMYAAISSSGEINTEQAMRDIAELANARGIWVMQGLNVVAWLLTPCLTLGMVAWLLGRLRKQEDPGWSAVFGRAKLFLKGIGLRLYVAWRVFLFMLPGLALSILAWLPVWLSDTGSRIAVLSAVNTSVGLQSAAMVVSVVRGVIAALKYALSDMVLADHPDYGPIRAAKKSREMTRGRKGAVFSLYLSFIFWYLLEMLAAGFCLSLFGEIPALMVQLLASLAITVYLNGSVSAFYLGYSGENAGTKTAEEQPTFEEEEMA